jgi:hypothetical protein
MRAIYHGEKLPITGLDDRHRDKNGRISRKHGNTLVGAFRKIYGFRFASKFMDSDKLSDV